MSDPPTRAKVLATGTRLGPFQLHEHLGSGGNARVFRAVDGEGRIVALKILHPGRASAEDLKRFEREFKSLERLDHPNVIQVYKAGETDGHAWLAMEYVDGTDLGGLVEGWEAQDPPDRWSRVERILRGLCAGLDAVHASGIVHRDLKPSNVLVGSDGEPKLTDFGVVKGDDMFSTNLTVAGQLLGTVAFMSPEQITGEGLDARSDLYALGAMLYVLLTGQRPIVADSIASYLARHLASEPKRPTQVRTDVPPGLERVCLKLLRKDPAGRYASARQVLDALEGTAAEPTLILQGRDGVLAHARELLAGLGQDGGGALGFVGPRGSGRSALVEVVAELARARGLPVERADQASGARAVVCADDLHLRQGVHVGELVEAVAEQGSLLVWSAVAEPGAAEPSSSSLGPQLMPLGGTVLALQPLDKTQTVALLRRAGVSGRLGPVLGRRLHDELSGWPGALVDQLTCLERAGWLRRDGLRLVASVPLEQLRSQPLPVPQRLRDELLRRLAEVKPAGRRLLQVVAVRGGQANADWVHSLAPISAAQGAALTESGLLRVRSEGLERILTLGPPRLGRVVYDALQPGQQQALHLQVAEALLARHARRPGAMAPVMAEHLMRAGQGHRAWPLWVQAARRAARRRDPSQTLALATRAHEAGEAAGPELDPSERRRLERETLALRGEALLACRQPEPAREALSAALDLGDPSDATALTARSALGAALVALGQSRAALQVLEPLVVELAAGHPARPAALRALAEAQRLEGQLGPSEATWREGLGLAQELGSREPAGLCLLGLAGTLIQGGQLVAAHEALSQALPLLRATRSEGQAHCLRSLAELQAVDGRYREALALADEAAELAQAREDLETWGAALTVTADVLELAGRNRDADRLRSEVQAVQSAVPTPTLLPRVVLAAQAPLKEAQSLESQGAHFPALGQAELAWSLLPGAGAGGLAHRVALMLCRLDPDTHREGRAAHVARAIAEELPPDLASSFRARRDVADLLG